MLFWAFLGPIERRKMDFGRDKWGSKGREGIGAARGGRRKERLGSSLGGEEGGEKKESVAGGRRRRWCGAGERRDQHN